MAFHVQKDNFRNPGSGHDFLGKDNVEDGSALPFGTLTRPSHPSPRVQKLQFPAGSRLVGNLFQTDRTQAPELATRSIAPKKPSSLVSQRSESLSGIVERDEELVLEESEGSPRNAKDSGGFGGLRAPQRVVTEEADIVATALGGLRISDKLAATSNEDSDDEEASLGSMTAREREIQKVVYDNIKRQIKVRPAPQPRFTLSDADAFSLNDSGPGNVSGVSVPVTSEAVAGSSVKYKTSWSISRPQTAPAKRAIKKPDSKEFKKTQAHSADSLPTDDATQTDSLFTNLGRPGARAVPSQRKQAAFSFKVAS